MLSDITALVNEPKKDRMETQLDLNSGLLCGAELTSDGEPGVTTFHCQAAAPRSTMSCWDVSAVRSSDKLPQPDQASGMAAKVFCGVKG
jgi:hypothetical protein